MSAAFADVTNWQVQSLLQQQPMCWIVPTCAQRSALLMPVVTRTDATGTIVSLLGHLPKRARATTALRGDNRAMFLCLGPNCYIGPDMAGRRDWAPTWNFASVAFEAEVSIDDNLTRDAIDAIVRLMEGDAGWSVTELGPRLDALMATIVGFEAYVTNIAPRMKLGQDEQEDTFCSIINALGNTPLADWMQGAAR